MEQKLTAGPFKRGVATVSGGAALAALWLVTSMFCMAQAAGPLAPSDLKCEYLTDPIGIDVAQPRLFWTPLHQGRGQSQTAYQVLVSTRPDASTGDIWDSGRRAAGETPYAVYPAGDGAPPLLSGTTYYWRVRYWDRDGPSSPSRRAAWLETGFLVASDWKGRWIWGGNQLRKEFSLPAKPVRVRVYVAALGYYELRVNGRKVGDHVLDPARTQYPKRVLYSAYDITDRLTAGPNAVGIMLGQGWFGNRAALLQIRAELPDGRKLEFSTDTTWRAANGPILADSVYDGAVYDARKETPNWDR